MPENENKLPFTMSGIKTIERGAETIDFKNDEEPQDTEEETSSDESEADINLNEEHLDKADDKGSPEGDEEVLEQEDLDSQPEGLGDDTTESEEQEGSEQKENEGQLPSNIFEITDGVFETEDELKRTSKLLKDNPELKGMLDFYEKNGTLLPYLQATQINPDSFKDEEMLWHQFKTENAELDLPEEDIRLLFEEDVLSKFNLDSNDDTRAKLGSIRMKKEANQIREKIKQDLKSLLLPKERDVNDASKELDAQLAQKKEANKNKLAFQIRKEIKEGKIEVKVDDKISVKLDASPRKISTLLENISDPSFLMTKEGNFDLKRMAILSDPDAFIASVVGNSKVEGKKEFIQTELKGRKPTGKQQGNGAPEPLKKFDPRDSSTWKGIKSIQHV